MRLALRTLESLVAKWLCQNSVIFSRNGCEPSSMRVSHQPRAKPMFCREARSIRAAAAAKSGSSGAPFSRRSMAFDGPSARACFSSVEVAPNAARRYRCPAFFKSHGLSGLGSNFAQAHFGSMRSAMTLPQFFFGAHSRSKRYSLSPYSLCRRSWPSLPTKFESWSNCFFPSAGFTA